LSTTFLCEVDLSRNVPGGREEPVGSKIHYFSIFISRIHYNLTQELQL